MPTALTPKIKIVMKPETIARRAAEREEATRARHANLVDRLRLKAEQYPEDPTWAELLAEVRP